MKICPECKTENKFDGAQYCKKCGAPLAISDNISVAKESTHGDELEFEVTETSEASAPQLFNPKTRAGGSNSAEELLEIKDNANLLEDEATNPSPTPEILTEMPRAVENEVPNKPQYAQPNEAEKMEKFKVDWGVSKDKPDKQIRSSEVAERSTEQTPSADDFSKKRVEINQPEDKKSEINAEGNRVWPVAHMQSQPDNVQDNDSQITKSARVRGVAYFYRNIIQLAGNPFLHENDELFFHEKPYLLKRYRPGKKARLIGIAALIIILSVVIGTQIIGPTLPGYGQIVGIILDKNAQPYLSGASIIIPDLGKSITSNEQGFFRFDEIPTGTYEIKYRLGSSLEGKDYITVTDGSLILRTFGDLKPVAEAVNDNNEKIAQEPARDEPAVLSASKNSDEPVKARAESGYGKIKLNANIDGAKFVVDGVTLGAGNMIYSGIKAGNRKIQVSKPGYTEYTEVVSVSSDQTKSLKINLSKMATASNEAQTAGNYFEQGNTSFLHQQYQDAISNFSKAIELSPNHIDAYSKRAQAYVSIGDDAKAAEDFIRLGEIYRFRNQNDMAITQFASALKYAPDSKTALVGRANARMDQGEYRSALIDYTRVLEIDDQFYPAQLGAGIAEFKLGDNKNAEKYLVKARKLDGSDPQLYHYLMLNCLARDDIKQMKKVYAQFKDIASSQELAEFKSSSRFEPVVRLIGETDL